MRHQAAWKRRPVCGLLAVAALLSTSAVSSASTPGQDSEAAAEPPPAPVQAALDDAARTAGVAVGSLRVTRVERVTWLDGSLGCPDPAMMYTQTLVPGYRIRIEAGDQSLDYHADMRGTVLLCPPERGVPPAADP